MTAGVLLGERTTLLSHNDVQYIIMTHYDAQYDFGNFGALADFTPEVSPLVLEVGDCQFVS